LRYADGTYSCESYNPVDGGLIASLTKRNAERAVLEAIPYLVAKSYIPSDVTGRNYLPSLMLKLGMSEGFTRGDLDRSMHRLIADGMIERKVEKSSNRSSDRVRLVVKQEAGQRPDN
jgi:hypothetical protein